MLDELQRLLDAATPGSWYPRATDDRDFQNARYISTVPHGDGMQHDGQQGMDVVNPTGSDCVIAVTLLQVPPLATAEECDENTLLICALRNAAPALIALARAVEAFALARDTYFDCPAECEEAADQLLDDVTESLIESLKEVQA